MEIGLIVLGLYMMNSKNPEVANKFIDKAYESNEELSRVINHFYKSAEKHDKSSYQNYVSQKDQGNSKQL